MSAILSTPAIKRDLEKMLAPNLMLGDRIFQKTVNGDSAATFHNLCNHKGPWLVICVTPEGEIVGAFSSASMNVAVGLHQNDDTAFIFVLAPGEPRKFPVKKGSPSSVYHHTGQYCNFGTGPVFCITTGANVTLNIRNDYGDEGCVLPNNRTTFSTNEIEAFTVIPRVGGPESLIGPINCWHQDVQAMKEFILSYSPAHGDQLGLDTVNLLVFGIAGASKSTWVNSIFGAFRGRMSNLAPAGGSGQHITFHLGEYFLANNTAICVKDVMGLSLQNYKGALFDLLLDGWLLPGFNCAEEPRIGDGQQFVRSSIPTLEDKIHAIIIFIPADMVTDAEMTLRIQDFVKRAASKNLQVLFVVSKVDGYVPLLKSEEYVPELYRDKTVMSLVRDVSTTYGFGQANILPLINFNDIAPPNPYVEYFVLKVLERSLDNADNYLLNRFQAHIRKQKTNATKHI